MLKKVNLKKLKAFGVNSDMLKTFHNAAVCSLMFGSVCWGKISKSDRGKLKQTAKKKKKKSTKKKQVIWWESYWTVLRITRKKDYKKLMQILNNPTHSMRHCADSSCSNRIG